MKLIKTKSCLCGRLGLVAVLVAAVAAFNGMAQWEPDVYDNHFGYNIRSEDPPRVRLCYNPDAEITELDTLYLPTHVTIGDKEYTVTAIDEYAVNYYHFRVKAIVLPPTIEWMDSFAIYYYNSSTYPEIIGVNELLNRISPGSWDCWIDAYSFDECYFRELNIPKVNYRVMGCWIDCCKIGTVRYDDKVSEISEGYFHGCEITDTIYLPSSLRTIEECAFQLAKLPDMTFRLPRNCANIRRFAFNASNVKSMIFQGGAAIHEGAFAYSALEYIKFDTLNNSAGNAYIYPEAFRGTKNLRQIELLEGSEICTMAFKDSGLTKVKMGSGSRFNQTGSMAFDGCPLDTVIYEARTPWPGPDDAFSDETYANATLFVTPVAYEKIKTTSPWKNFAKIKLMTDLIPGWVDGVDSPIADEDEESTPVIFTLDGRLVITPEESLPPGVYIVRQNGETRKIVIN